MSESLKIAIVTDWLTDKGGAEKVLDQFLDMYPDADILTSVYIPEKFPELQNRVVKTSFLQILPAFLKKRHQVLFPFLPLAIESLDTRGYDIVISSSSFVAKGVVTTPETLHLCYCHTPTRYLWDEWQEILKSGLNIPRVLRFLKPIFPWLFVSVRQWDFLASSRVDSFIANSQVVQKRIQKYYRRKSTVLRPPVDYDFFSQGKKTEKRVGYVAYGRLIPYKRFDLLIEVFKRMPDKKLVIAGNGPEKESLMLLAQGCLNIHFAGFVPDDDLRDLLTSSKGYLFPQNEDAGITPMEAMTCGTPTIAYKKGGAIGLVKEGKNGVFFNDQTVESLIDAIKRFEEMSFDEMQIQSAMENFSIDRFRSFFESHLKSEYEKHQKNFG